MPLTKKSIVIVTDNLPPNYGGADIAAWKYTKLLESNGQDVIIIGSKTTNFSNTDYSFKTYYGIKYTTFKQVSGYMKLITDWITLITCYISIFGFVLKNKSRILIIHSFNSSAYINTCFIHIASMFNIPIITETSLMGSDDPLTLFKSVHPKRKMLAKYVSRRFAQKATYYISKSPFISNSYNNTPLRNKYKEIPYMVDSKVYKPISNEDKKMLRYKLQLHDDKKIILFVGGINPRKGIHILIDSFRSLLKDNKDVFLLLVGPTNKYNKEYISQVHRAIEDIGPEFARLVDDVSKTVHEWMQIADIYCLPSFKEGFPISIVEALSSGLVVVASDIPEIKDVQIRHKENGFLFKTGDSHSLYIVLKECLSFNQLEVASNARREAIHYYDVNVVAELYSKLYNQLLVN